MKSMSALEVINRDPKRLVLAQGICCSIMLKKADP